MHICGLVLSVLSSLCPKSISDDSVIEPKFVMSVMIAADGTYWAGTEGEGLFYRIPGGNKWSRDASFDCVGGTNIFALCEDRFGRIWAGTLDCGVCVKDSDGWKRFSIEEGLAGSRVYSLASDEKDNVWIATEGGLCRYSESRETLTVYNRASGLDAGEITSIATTSNGDVVIGTACSGVYRSNRMSLWKKWERIELSGVQINSVSLDDNGRLLIVSNEGIEIESSAGSGKFVCKKRRSGEPKPTACAFDGRCPFVGFEEHGVYEFSFYRNKFLSQRSVTQGKITSLAFRDKKRLFGKYGGGVVLDDEMETPRSVFIKRRMRKLRLPVTVVFEAKPLCSKRSRARCYYMNDDWTTKGDWCGRYGLRTAILCAQYAQYGDETICNDPRYVVESKIGETRSHDDVLRRWMHWRYTTNPNSLYNPHLGHRRQSEWDDHSEVYPQSNPGPDLIVKVKIPKDWHEISFYFFNKDGEYGQNFRRDYMMYAFGDSNISSIPLVSSRVRHFRNGVYKRFAAVGPGDFVFRIERGNSYSTILSGVFVRKMSESPESQFAPRISTCIHYGGLVYREPMSDLTAIPDFHSCLSGADYDRCIMSMQSKYRDALNRNDKYHVRLFRWLLRVWNRSERCRFEVAMNSAWTCLQMKNPKYRFAENFPDSPNVLSRKIDKLDYGQQSPLYWLNDSSLKNSVLIRKADGQFYRRVVNLVGTMDYMRE